jgi:hypothetical protein
VPVEVLAGTVVAHRGSGAGVTGGDLDVSEFDSGVKMVVRKVCRSMCWSIRAMAPACLLGESP